MKIQLSHHQFVYMMIWLVMGTGVLTLPFAISQFTIRDSWISATLMAISPMSATVIAGVFIRTFPKQSLVQGLLTAFGPWIGRILGLWLLVWIYVLTAMVVRELTLFVEVDVLPVTPIYIISVLIVIPVGFAVSRGVEVIARLAEILTPIAVIVTLMLVLLGTQHVDITHLRPLLADGWSPVLRATVVPWAFSMEVILSLQIACELPDGGRHLVRDLVIAGGIMTLFGLMAEVSITLVLGHQRVYSLYPILEMLRTIHYGDFLERLDPLYAMGATSLIVLKTSILHFTWVEGMKDTFRLQNLQSVVWGGAMAIWAGSIFLWSDSAVLVHYMLFTVFGYFFVTLLLLPIAAIVTQQIRNRFSSQKHVQPSPAQS